MKVSIVTLTIGSPRYLDEAVASIERDGPYDIEHIVVHDGDAGYISALVQQYPATRVVKGLGAGATAAAVQGVEAATGDFILFLHSDDRLCPGALARLSTCAAARPGVKIWTGGARIFRTLPCGREVTVRRMFDRTLTRLSLENVCDDLPLLSARFCHRSVYAEIGNFDAKFSESSDREFLLRAVVASVPEASLEAMVSALRWHEESRTIHRRLGWIPPYLAEHVRLADVWLARPIERRTRRFLRNWRAREVLRLALYRWRAGQWGSAADMLLREELSDPLWIVRSLTGFEAHLRRNRRND
jgi:glycosyltransferase involved in cell wall biosynthesis